jgi:hypothetical protein
MGCSVIEENIRLHSSLAKQRKETWTLKQINKENLACEIIAKFISLSAHIIIRNISQTGRNCSRRCSEHINDNRQNKFKA